MRRTDSIEETRGVVRYWREHGHSVGLVPTMGFLHEGHVSLIRRARADNEKVAVSIFVNPTQFGPGEDYESYPRDLERDLSVLSEENVDLVFIPSPEQMYSKEHFVYVDVESLGDVLCGAQRPGHFRGVCTVVAKLFNIFRPDRAYFGQKDAQQLTIIRQMARDLNFGVEIVRCPIVREPDGLALSSRNAYLSEKERKAALVIPRSLSLARNALENGERDAGRIRIIIAGEIEKEPLACIGYVEVVDASSLRPVERIDRPVLAAVAVKIGPARLIDNFMYPEDS
ncbi:MAG: pantoate--beta-alanine ligase [Clostridiales bacterium]|nr:pantoate--beta-alanine ligase [Clostridiales bacterium]